MGQSYLFGVHRDEVAYRKLINYITRLRQRKYFIALVVTLLRWSIVSCCAIKFLLLAGAWRVLLIIRTNCDCNELVWSTMQNLSQAKGFTPSVLIPLRSTGFLQHVVGAIREPTIYSKTVHSCTMCKWLVQKKGIFTVPLPPLVTRPWHLDCSWSCKDPTKHPKFLTSWLALPKWLWALSIGMECDSINEHPGFQILKKDDKDYQDLLTPRQVLVSCKATWMVRKMATARTMTAATSTRREGSFFSGLLVVIAGGFGPE